MKHLIYIFIFLLCMAIMAITPVVGAQEIKIGDKVEFSFLGETVPAMVTNFDADGHPVVRFRYERKVIDRSILIERLSLLESSGSEAMNGGETINEGDPNDPDNPFGKVIGKKPANKSNNARARGTVLDPKSNSRELREVRWNVSLDPAPETAEIGYDRIEMPIPANVDIYEFSPLVMNADERFVATCLKMDNDHNVDQIAFIGIETGQTFFKSISTGLAKPLAISQSGKRVVTVGKQSPDQVVAFWDIENPQKPIDMWTFRFHGSKIRPPNIKSGWLLSDDRLLTFGDDLVLWDVPNRTAIYSYPASFGSHFTDQVTISGGGNYVTFNDDDNKATYLIETATGDIHGSINKNAVRYSFSPDGRFLAGHTNSNAWVWDLKNNELFSEIDLTKPTQRAFPINMTSLSWVGSKHILIDGSSVMDIETGKLVWTLAQQNGPDRLLDLQVLGGPSGSVWLFAGRSFIRLRMPIRDIESSDGRKPGKSTITKDGLQ